MFVKGTAYLARREMLIRELGEERWTAFFEEYLRENPGLDGHVLATAQIPVLEFIRLNDAVIDRFYGGDPETYLRFGEASANWALTEGPYSKLRIARDSTAFIERQTQLFRLYYTEGESSASLDGDEVDYRIRAIPEPYRHVYLEYSPVGYLRRGLDLTGRKVLSTDCLKGFSRGDSEVHYRLRLKK